MTAPRLSRRTRLAALTTGALALTGLPLLVAPTASANADGTDLVIREVYPGGGSSNVSASYTRDFVELYNPTDAALPLSGLSLQYRATGFNGTPGNVSILELPDQVVPADDSYLVAVSDVVTPPATPGGADLPEPDFSSTVLNMGQSNGQVILVDGVDPVVAVGQTMQTVPTVIDFVGYGTSNSSETTATTGTGISASVSRSATGTDTDNNLADFTAGTPTPQAATGDTGVPLALAATDPGDRTGQVGEPLSFELAATGGTAPYTWDVEGLPDGVTAEPDGTVAGTPTETGTFLVVATVTDSATPTAATDTVQFDLIVAAEATLTDIADVQGDGASSPLAGLVTIVQGEITAIYPAGGFNGFYVQTPGADTPGASDAIFVYGPSFDETTLAIGDSVEVRGRVSEFTTSGANTLTEITAQTVTDIADLPGDVTPKATIPGTDCAVGSCPTLAAVDALKEAAEGELFAPAGDFTVTDVYDGSATNPSGTASSSNFGELGLAANSDTPLIAPTEIIDSDDTAALAAQKAYNDAHRVVLDDGSSRTFWNITNDAANQDDPVSWFTRTYQVRVGAGVMFPQPVVLENRFGWKIQPTTTVNGAPTAQQPQFEQDRPAAPAAVGGDLRLATFNVLNYFTTLGDSVAGCEPFLDKDDEPVAVDGCPGNGPRGAWDQEDFDRQRAKIVNAINTMDADIVSLEEIENSAKVDGAGTDRDEALADLVDALNEDAGATRWAYVPSPAPADRPAVEDEDVIRTGFIYDPSTVALVGTSKILTGSAPFANAREPLAQAFKAVGAVDAAGFAVIVNHFKSKGSSGATGDNVDTGQGAYNGDRTRQAQALASFAGSFATGAGVGPVLLTGDFNSYTQEDPVQVLTGGGWTNLESTDDPAEETYSFDGSSGSLDHVLANAAAVGLVTGVDIWEINANETVFNQYSRYNYVGTDLYDDGPFSASDHNPEIIGFRAPQAPVATSSLSVSDTSVQYGKQVTVTATVTATGGDVPTGTVTVRSGTTVLGSGAVAGGRATITLPARSLPAGTQTLTADYSGNLPTSTDTFVVTVTKAGSSTEATVKPKAPKKGKKVTLSVRVVGTDGVPVTGRVKITVAGDTRTKTLANGKLKLSLGRFGKGTYKVKVVYLGDANIAGSKDKVTFTVS